MKLLRLREGAAVDNVNPNTSSSASVERVVWERAVSDSMNSLNNLFREGAAVDNANPNISPVVTSMGDGLAVVYVE